jgi:hypothetical protein
MSIEIHELNISPKNLDSLMDLPRDFPFPDLDCLLYFANKEIVVDGKVRGAVFVKLTAEVILIIDDTLPLMTRARAIMKADEVVTQDIEKFGLDGVHAFVCDCGSEKFLIEKLGFIECKGKPLFKRNVNHG